MDEPGVVVPSRPVCVMVDRHIVAARLKSDLADAYHDKTMAELDRGGQDEREQQDANLRTEHACAWMSISTRLHL